MKQTLPSGNWDLPIYCNGLYFAFGNATVITVK